MKFDPSVKREIAYVSLGTLFLSALEVGGFAAFGYYTNLVLFGIILSAAAGILNFVLLAMTVERALSYSPEEEGAAKAFMKMSQTARMLFLLAILAVGVLFFNRYSPLITIFFPRIIIGFRSVRLKKTAPLPSPDNVEKEPETESENVLREDIEQSETKGSDTNQNS